MFSDEEVTEAWETFRKEGMRQVMELAVQLKASGGTMTAEQVESDLASLSQRGSDSRAERLRQHISAICARNAVLEAEKAEIEREAADQYAEAVGINKLHDAALARNAVLEVERDEARGALQSRLAHERQHVQQIEILRSENQQLRAGNERGQCSNPDPTTGPTCTERGCEGQTCQYPKVKPAPIPDPCICGGEEHHTFHCPARTRR